MTVTDTGVWELTICDSSGTTVTKHDNVLAAYHTASEYVRPRWDDMFPPDEVNHHQHLLPADDRAAVQDYFRRAETAEGHWFSISVPMDLESGPVMVSELEPLPKGMCRWHRGIDGFEAITDAECALRSAAVRAEWSERGLAASVLQARSKYPTRWPAKYRYLLDAIRETIDECPGWAWNWYPSGASGGIKPGGFVLTNPVGGEEVFSSLDELAETLGVPTPRETGETLMRLLGAAKTARKTPARKITAIVCHKCGDDVAAPPPPAVVHTGHGELLEFIRRAKSFIFSPELTAEADALLAAA